MTKTVQIWASMGNLNNDLEQKICQMAGEYGATKVKTLGGGGDSGSFYAVYRTWIPDGYEKDFVEEVKSLKASDGGGHYYYGSAKVTIKEKEVKVTDAQVVEDKDD